MKVKQLITTLSLIVITVITYKTRGMEFLGLEYLNNAHKRTYTQAFGQSTQEHNQKQMNSYQPSSGPLFAYLTKKISESKRKTNNSVTTTPLPYQIEIEPAQYAKYAPDQSENETDTIDSYLDKFLATYDNNDDEASITTTEQHDEKIQQQNSVLPTLAEKNLQECCKLCGKSLANSSNLKKHIKSIHNKERVACTVPGCTSDFANSSNLKRHINSIHNKERVACTVQGCKASFSNPSSRSKHIKRIHNK